MSERTLECSSWDNSECVGTRVCPPRCPRFVDKEGVSLIARRYEDEDFDAVVQMYEDLDVQTRSMGVPPVKRPQIESWITRLTERGWNLLVLDDDRVVGHVAVVPASTENPEFLIFVHDDYQDRGIGSELMRQVIAYAADQRHDALSLHVSKGNRRAISVYRRVGFEVTEEEAAKLAMQLSLDSDVADRVRRPPAER